MQTLGVSSKKIGRDVLASIEVALELARKTVNTAAFSELVEALATMEGKCIVTGVGKSAIAARKIAATLATVGAQAMFLDPIGMFHGELGMLRMEDIVIMVSQSGETDELKRLIEPLAALSVEIAPIVGERNSRLGRLHCALVTGATKDPFFNVPTASIAAAIAVGDALAIAVAVRMGFTDETLKITHPGNRGAAHVVRAKKLGR